MVFLTWCQLVQKLLWRRLTKRCLFDTRFSVLVTGNFMGRLFWSILGAFLPPGAYCFLTSGHESELYLIMGIMGPLGVLSKNLDLNRDNAQAEVGKSVIC